MARIKLKPAREGLLVRNPFNMEHLPAEGAEVEESTYWLRRLQDGDVVVVQEEKPAVAKASNKAGGDSK